jgi:sporulation protein YlmC with PRC-barrel domain
MLLSDLLEKPVQTGDGSSLGTIVDVRFHRGQRNGRHEGPLELIALIVSPHSRHSMYGYERGRVNGPLVIAALIRWLHRKSRVIPWDCVSRVEEDAVVLGVEPPLIPLDVRSPIR